MIRKAIMSKKPGLNLADLAPLHEDVTVGDSFLRIHGISAKMGLEILKRFPKLLDMVGSGKFDLKTFLVVAPDAVATIIATAAGHFEDEKAEAAAAALGIEIQWDIIEAIGRLTFTRGFAPFAARLMAMLGDEVKSGSSSRAMDTKSPPASRPLSPVDILPQ
jgi:hypothetical protein